MRITHRAAVAVLFALVLLGGCAADKAAPPQTLTLATTTSTQDSGLLDVLIPEFERLTQIEVRVVAVGSGQALELARRGDADVLMTHAPDAEQKFLDEGWGNERRAIMHNDFVIVGSADDPAAIEGVTSVVAAFEKIAEVQAPFVSRGDDSGTHQKENALWKAAEIEPAGEWYVRAGTSMANALRIADEQRAYTLSDRATFLAHRDRLDLAILFEGDDRLINRYAVITINPEKHPHLAHAAAEQFAEFLVSPAGQSLIGEFGVEKFGEPLFFPDAVRTE